MTEPALPGLYIHVPLCRTKCPYCDFYSCTDLSAADDFVAALAAELARYRDRFPAVGTVYLGGGTPSALATEQLEALMAAVRRLVAVAPEAEITIEANPNDLGADRLARLRSLGFNRLSLGVQSFDDAVLGFLGRRHTAEEARRAIGQARDAGFDNISLDFMYALPGQARDAWLAILEEALAFAPEHLSCYQLTIKEGTLFFERARRGEFSPCPDEEQAELFLATSAFLEGRGYSHYEVSSFCRAENLQARHNRAYWEHGPYLGLGPSAHSFDGRRRWWNVRSVAGYVQVLLNRERECGQAGLPVEGCEELTPEQQRSEAVMLGLRTKKGIALSLVQKQPEALQALERLQAGGLVTVSHGRVRPTTRGMLMADSLAALL